MIKRELPLTSIDGGSNEASLSYLEKNALRYAAGYVTRHLRKQLQRSAHPNKAEFELCLLDLNDAEISTDDSEDWVRSIDRGGLKYVSDMTYMVFMSMEQEVRKHLKIGKVSQGPQRETIERHIKKNTDVLFYWCIVSAEWEDTTASTLLDMIVTLWVTIRGFSGASGWLEKYKQMNKTTVQKSKGVRKQLVSTSTK